MTLELSTITREPKCETCGVPTKEHTDACSRHEFVMDNPAPAPPLTANGQVDGAPEWAKADDPKALARELRLAADKFRYEGDGYVRPGRLILLAADLIDRLAADRERLDREVRALERWAVFEHQGFWFARISTPSRGHRHRLFEEGVAWVRGKAGINPGERGASATASAGGGQYDSTSETDNRSQSHTDAREPMSQNQN